MLKMNYNRLFMLRAKGLNMQEIADDMGMHRVTIQRHFLKFKEMNEEDFKKFYKEVMLI